MARAIIAAHRTMSLFQSILEQLEYRRARRIAEALRPYLSADQLVLDLGCGPLLVAEQIQKVCGVRVVGLDTASFRKRPLPLVLYSGGRAPFKDGSFDHVLIAFVLHQCEDGGVAVLQEARRLARGRILLLEESYDSALDRVAVKTVDRFLNRLENPQASLPDLFRSSSEWKSLFDQLGFKLAETRRMRTTPLLRTRQVLYLLES